MMSLTFVVFINRVEFKGILELVANGSEQLGWRGRPNCGALSPLRDPGALAQILGL